MLIGAQSENIIWIGSVSTLVEYFVAIGCIVISYRMLKAKMNLNWLLRIGLFTLLMATTGWLITKQFLLVEWWWQLVVMLVMALIYYVSMGFISVKEGFKLLSAKIK
jgi:small-conductance mechanosensitive channel